MGDVSTHKNVNYTNRALKKRQQDVLKKSLESITTIPVSERDHTYTMMAINRDDIQSVKQEIKQFRRKMAQFLEREGVKPNSIYQLHIGFYPLSRIQKGDEK